MSARDNAATLFAQTFGGHPEAVAFAPGRVNLIGDHVDYNDGFVLPMPLTVGTAVAWRPRADRNVVVHAADFDDGPYEFGLTDEPPVRSGWHSLVHGMVALMQGETPLAQGLDLLVTGDLPRGAGLSSSASLCIAVGRAVAAAAGRNDLPPARMALVAQQVEHRYAGVACGIMDQMVIAAGDPASAMLLDCRSLVHERVDVPADWSVLIVQSGIRRELVDGAYNERRQQCESAARKLGVVSLREVDPATADYSGLELLEARRARHVVSEIARTRSAADAIRAGAIGELGALLRAAHVSMRDDFEASHPAVDRLVHLLNVAIGPEGGARMTGGGFGGAIVAICRSRDAERALAAIHASADGGGLPLQTMRAFQ